MTHTKEWRIDIHIDEHDTMTRAEVRLHNPDETALVGVGMSRCHPDDVGVPKIGDELAVARALADLARQLRDTTSVDIAAITHERVHLEA